VITNKPVRTRLSPDQRRAELLRHAIACLADHGIARATQAQVAARAGVSVSAVYSYFRTRADLVTAVLQTVETTITAMVEGALAAPAPAHDALIRLATHTADMALREPDIVRVWLDWSTGVSADVWPQFLLMQRRLQALIESVLIGSGDGGAELLAPYVKSAARLFVGGAHTLALMRFENVCVSELELFIDQMVSGVMAASGLRGTRPRC
jgi:TetR/AcrR family hemagglutinin/protease transcriptional regulator